MSSYDSPNNVKMLNRKLQCQSLRVKIGSKLITWQSDRKNENKDEQVNELPQEMGVKHKQGRHTKSGKETRVDRDGSAGG